jgi:hypothetical protein
MLCCSFKMHRMHSDCRSSRLARNSLLGQTTTRHWTRSSHLSLCTGSPTPFPGRSIPTARFVVSLSDAAHHADRRSSFSRQALLVRTKIRNGTSTGRWVIFSSPKNLRPFHVAGQPRRGTLCSTISMKKVGTLLQWRNRMFCWQILKLSFAKYGRSEFGRCASAGTQRNF